MVRTRGGALADGVQETWSEVVIFRVVFPDVEMAGAEFEDALEECHGLAEGADIGEWAQDFCAFVLGVCGVTGDEDSGEVIAIRDYKIRESFIINEEGVEAWSYIFDESIFGEERFPFGFTFDDVEVGDEGEHGLFFGAEVGGGEEV